MPKLGALADSATDTAVNQNNDTLETAFQNTLSRDGSAPNSMNADLDMNGNDILNVGTLYATSNVTSNLVVYNRTQDETDGGVDPVNLYYPPGNVLRYGADPTGTNDSSTAFQDAINGLNGSYGGRVYIPAGAYKAGDINVLKSKFSNGGVLIEMDPRSVVNVKAGSTYFLKFAGNSETDLLQYCGLTGGRIVGTVDDANYGLWFVNCANWYVEHCSIRQFYSSSRSTRAGIYTQYSIYGTVTNPNIQVCDFGFNFENNAANTYRQTTISIFGGNVQTCYRAMRIDDGCQIHAYSTSFENSSIGVLYDFTRTSGTNNFSCSLNNCYFERNGLHIKVTEHGTAISRGINITGCFLESVTTTYSGGGSFEDAGSGNNKVILDGQLHTIDKCYFSTASAVSDIVVESGASNNYIGLQNRLKSDVSISDSGTSTIIAATPIGADSDAVINKKWRWTDELRLSNNIKLRGLNAAGTAYRDLLHISTSDNTILGNVSQGAIIYASSQPDWYNGATTQHIATSTGTTGGAGSGGAGNQYVQLNINGTTYKILHDGTV